MCNYTVCRFLLFDYLILLGFRVSHWAFLALGFRPGVSLASGPGFPGFSLGRLALGLRPGFSLASGPGLVCAYIVCERTV